MIVKNALCFFIPFLAVVVQVYGQDTTYYTDNGQQVQSLQSADYYGVAQREPADSNRVTVRTYFPSGQIRSEIHYSDYKKDLYGGKVKKYYKNGRLKIDADYIDGKLNGQALSYWENGKPKRKDLYRNDKLIKGTCYGADGHPIPHFPFMQMPSFPGGETALMHYLASKIKYPRQARKKNITGKVVIQFIVNRKGKITNPTIAESVSPDLGNEALHVVQGMPDWKPGIQDGEPVNVQYNLPVQFQLQ